MPDHGDGAGPLSAASRREMQQGYRLIPPDPEDPTTPVAGAYGFGLVAGHDPDHGAVVSHAGEYPGFSAPSAGTPPPGSVWSRSNATYAGVSRVAVPPSATSPRGDGYRRGVGTGGPPPSPRRRRSCGCSATGTTPSPPSSSAATSTLDQPLARRRAGIAGVVARAGTLGAVDEERGDGPADRSWRVRGEHADLRCTITMTPRHPPARADPRGPPRAAPRSDRPAVALDLGDPDLGLLGAERRRHGDELLVHEGVELVFGLPHVVHDGPPSIASTVETRPGPGCSPSANPMCLDALW